jgi:carbamoylphosphate synthase small subunit
MSLIKSVLVLEDGRNSVRLLAEGDLGEMVFKYVNVGLPGVLTDPSHAGQIVCRRIR